MLWFFYLPDWSPVKRFIIFLGILSIFTTFHSGLIYPFISQSNLFTYTTVDGIFFKAQTIHHYEILEQISSRVIELVISYIAIKTTWTPNPNNRYGNSIHHWVIALMAKLANEDGPINKPEIDWIDGYIKRHVPMESGWKAYKLASADPDTYIAHIERHILNYFTKVKPDRKGIEAIFAELVSLARCDGQLAEKEVQFLDFFLYRCQFDSQYMANARNQLNQLEKAPAALESEKSLSDCYADLGLSIGATLAEVHEKYRLLAKEFHPDKVSGLGLNSEYTNFAQERFMRIQSAYQRIVDSMKI
jgi:DnaJ like chaperone protein